MTAPTFGRLEDAERPTFGSLPARVHVGCVAGWGFACPGPGPHAAPLPPDPATVPAFPELEPTPSLWAAPAGPEPAQDGPRCAVRYSDTQEGPLATCQLPAGHPGRHEGDSIR